MTIPASIFCVLMLSLTGQMNMRVNTGSSGTEPELGLDQLNLIQFVDIRGGDTLHPVNVNNWWGYMNQKGDLVVYPQFDWADDFYEGLARATADGRTGYIKGNGNWMHEPRFEYNDRYADGRAVVGDGQSFGYIDKTGDLIVPVRLDGALRFNESVAAVMMDGKCGFINAAGELEIPLQFTQARSFHEGVAAVRWPGAGEDEDVPGYIDRRGKQVFADTSGRVTFLGDFHDGLARVQGNDKWGFIGRNFKIRIDARFDEARDFSNGVAAVRVGEKWGFIDKSGRFVIEPMFDEADDMEDPLAMITLAGKVGFIDRAGKQGIDPQFDSARPFFRDLARVEVEPAFAYIGRTGKVTWDPRNALRGFKNNTTKEKAVIAAYEKVIHNREVPAPAYREPIPVTYPPDYLYDGQLPPP